MLRRLRPKRQSDDTPIAHGNAWLIVGLGNPGRRYQGTRHNAGFMVVDRLAGGSPPGTTRSRMQAELLETRLDDRRLVLAKPQTFMNSSGESVSQLVRWYKVDLSRLLVIYDDLDLPFGVIRLRAKGSAGGHNGLSSIVQQLGSEQFPRLRVGIGRPMKGSTIPYVLSSFFENERPKLPGIIDHAVGAVHDWLVLGIDAAMNLHNRRAEDIPDPDPDQS